MATKKNPTTGGMQLPSAESFVDVAVVDQSDGQVPGTVVDLDYEQWAPAIVDTADREDRINGARQRLQQRGYQKVEGEVQVIQFPKAEVWVIPRSLHEARAKQDRRDVAAAVRDGRLTDSATAKPVVTGGSGDD